MILKTNQLAVHEINKHHPFQKSSRYNKWNKVNFEEINKIVWNFFLWGTVRLPTIKHYWSTDDLYSFSGCLWAMSQTISNNSFFSGILPTMKMKNATGSATELLNNKMGVIYVPEKKLSIIMFLQGRLFFRQYIKNKRHKYGVKFYQIWPIWHFSKDDYNLGQTGAIVMNPMDGYL